MKFNRMIRNAMATTLSAGLGLGTVACSRDYTADYVYSISASNPSTVSAFAVDYQTGILTQITGSPFQTNFSNASTIVSTPNGAYVYVISGSFNSAVQAFAVGSDGKLYEQNQYNITGTVPTGAAIDSSGSFLYVTYKYQIGYGPVSVGPGGVSIFAINPSNGSLGTPLNVNVGNNPVGITIAPPTTTQTAPTVGAGTVYAYVVDAEGSNYSPGASPTLLSFQANIVYGSGSSVTGNGMLTPTTQTVYNSALRTYQGIVAGVAPSALIADPTGRYVYVTDKLNNEIYGYGVVTNQKLAAGGGTLAPLVSSPFNTGLYPVAITIDPRGKYVYTANYNSNTVSSFSLNIADGSLGGTATIGNFTTATGPTCVTVDPALGIYLYTSNYLDGSISGGQLNPNTGQLNSTINTPYPTGTFPSCVTSVANGSHAIQTLDH
jgi:6-phosphogluconolactonase (cycloisomerase 2 family)